MGMQAGERIRPGPGGSCILVAGATGWMARTCGPRAPTEGRDSVHHRRQSQSSSARLLLCLQQNGKVIGLRARSGAGVRSVEQAFDVKSRPINHRQSISTRLNRSLCCRLQSLLTAYLALSHDDEVLFWFGVQVLDQCERNPGFDVLFAPARRAGL